jgi:type I restriction enzyme M protein
LLLKAADESRRGITIYGQEMDNATAALAKMNMILHDNPTAEIWQDNTLASPHFLEKAGGLKQHDFAVANRAASEKHRCRRSSQGADRNAVGSHPPGLRRASIDRPV